MQEEETVIGEIGAVDNTKSVLQLETRYLSHSVRRRRLSFAASRSLTFQSKFDEHQKGFTQSGNTYGLIVVL